MGSSNGQTQTLMTKVKVPRPDAEGKIPCDVPGCETRVKPAGLHMHKARMHSSKGSNWSTSQTGEFPCDHCSRVLKSSSALSKHRHRQHETLDVGDANALFERLGSVTRALFPNGVPNERIIEVAEWQKVTLQLMRRG